MTFYDELGLDKAASPDVVRRAYLRRSKQVHPDVGGSDAEFERVHRAYLILRDPVRRARYDATGDASGIEPDNSHAEVLATLANHLDAVMNYHVQNGGHLLTQSDWVDAMRRRLGDSYKQINSGTEAQRRIKSYWQRLSGRFTRAEGASMLAQIVEARIADVDRGIAEGERRLAVLNKALSLLKEETFRRDEHGAMKFPVSGGPFHVQGLRDMPFGR